MHEVKEIIEGKDIPPHRPYGSDEVGFMLGYGPQRRVVGPAGASIQHDKQDQTRDMITVFNTICGDGTAKRSVAIYPGMNYQRRWLNQGNPLKIRCVSEFGDRLMSSNTQFSSIWLSENGWTDDELGVSFIKDFDEQTRDANDPGTRFWALDSHHSHCTNELIDYAHDNDIEIVTYVPKTTHLLQGLDVACFGALKIYWGQERDKHKDKTGMPVTKDSFLEVYTKAHTRAFTESTILSAFRVTGLSPLDPSVITEEKLAPSQETSIQGAFPLPQPPGVAAILNAFTEPSDPQTPPATPPPGVPRTFLTHFHPDTLTPCSKRAHRLAQNLHTQGCDYLVPGEVFDSTHSPASPQLHHDNIVRVNAELFRPLDVNESKKEIIRKASEIQAALKTADDQLDVKGWCLQSANAQIVVQGAHLKQLHRKLFHKEKKKKSAGAKRKQLQQSKVGRCLTWDAFVEESAAIDEEEKIEKTRKEMKKKKSVERTEARMEVEGGPKTQGAAVT